jgi:hypothetical protein
MEKEIATLIEAINADYEKFMKPKDENDEVRINMNKQFRDSVSVEEGTKYIKIVKNDSVWGFIVKTDKDAKFKRGDILKAASWAAPARNHARGNILEGGYRIYWTGPHYMI